MKHNILGSVKHPLPVLLGVPPQRACARGAAKVEAEALDVSAARDMQCRVIRARDGGVDVWKQVHHNVYSLRSRP